jgi:hypothetical protein
MTGFLSRLSERAAGAAPVVQPRPRSRFEPGPGAPQPSDLEERHEEVEVASPSVPPSAPPESERSREAAPARSGGGQAPERAERPARPETVDLRPGQPIAAGSQASMPLADPPAAAPPPSPAPAPPVNGPAPAKRSAQLPFQGPASLDAARVERASSSTDRRRGAADVRRAPEKRLPTDVVTRPVILADIPVPVDVPRLEAHLARRYADAIPDDRSEIHVHIGRVEVRPPAPAAPPPASRPPSPFSPGTALGDYLGARGAGSRR